MAVVTLTTDFGSRDWFVGTMKGVILGINPKAVVVDITHEVAPGDLHGAAFALAAAAGFFPPGTVHVVVVDPGVGSGRQALAVQTRDCFFVGPDNGVLSVALRRRKVIAVQSLEKEQYFLPTVSRTFHGRDVFAPVAAHLSRGLAIARLGSPRKTFVRLTWPTPQRRQGKIEGMVVYIDRFGNAITNLESVRAGTRFQVYGCKRFRCRLVDFYQAVPTGSVAAVPGSSGLVEIAVNGGSAANVLGLKIGSRVIEEIER